MVPIVQILIFIHINYISGREYAVLTLIMSLSYSFSEIIYIFPTKYPLTFHKSISISVIHIYGHFHLTVEYREIIESFKNGTSKVLKS